MVAPWTYLGISLTDFKKQLIPRVKDDLFKVDFSLDELGQALLEKVAFGQPISLVDLYGGILARKLLAKGADDPYQIELTSQTRRVSDGHWMYPIYTAIVTKKPYEWLEFTPHEVGSDYLGGYIPQWAFGRKFFNGVSQDFAPPQSLGFLMGIWGSAFAANVKEVLTNFEKKIKPRFLLNILQSGAQETIIGRQRLLPAKVYNFTYGMVQLPRGQQEMMTLIDAGVHFNLPLPPLLRKERAVDIVVVFDLSGNIKGGGELKKTQDYFAKKNIKLPPIDYQHIDTQICSIFRDETDPTVPVIIYLPRIKNDRYGSFDPDKDCLKSFCDTFNFKYNATHVEKLSGLTEFNIKESKDTIIQVIKQVVERKRRAVRISTAQKK